MQSIGNNILRRIRGRGRGSIFSAKDFLDLGSRAAIDQALSRLSRTGKIRRLRRGLYDYPKIHSKLGPLSPTPDRIAHAVAAKTKSRLQPSGARAANTLGLTTQVPAKSVFLTDGPSRQVHIGHQTVYLKHVTPKYFLGDGVGALAIQALRYLGKDGINDNVVRKLRDTMSRRDKVKLKQSIRYVVDWMAPVLQQIAEAS